MVQGYGDDVPSQAQLPSLDPRPTRVHLLARHHPRLTNPTAGGVTAAFTALTCGCVPARLTVDRTVGGGLDTVSGRRRVCSEGSLAPAYLVHAYLVNA
jgi:hypothetical protein